MMDTFDTTIEINQSLQCSLRYIANVTSATKNKADHFENKVEQRQPDIGIWIQVFNISSRSKALISAKVGMYWRYLRDRTWYTIL